MALNDAALGALIKTEIEAEFGAADDAAILTKFCNAVAKAVNSHIKSNAQVSTNLASGGQVASGPGAGGTLTGSVPGTVT